MPDPPVKQACDACRRRKVKCIFPKPCEQCRVAGLVCRTTSQRQKKGRQGQTANILNELRANQIEQALVRDANMSPPSAALTLGDNIPTPQSLRALGRCQFSKTPGLLSRELVDSCSGYFFLRMRGTVPVLQPGSFQKQVDLADTSLHAYCLVTAFCAFVVTQTGFAVEHSSLELSQGFCTEEFRNSLIEEATEARKHIDPFTDPVRQSIIIAFLLYGCHIGLGNQRHAYYFLRESTTLYTASALESQASSAQTDDDDPSLAGKLFWLLVVSERAHAIRRHRPITLQVTPESPQLEDGPLPTQQEDDPLVNASAIGFRCLVNLYRPFDEGFLGQWNGTNATCTVESLVRLEELIQSAVPADLDLPDILMADLHLCFATWKLSRQSMETHGIGLIEKIFEVACTLIDVMACLSAAGLRSSGFKLGPQDYLKHFFTLIHDLPGGRRRFLPLLLTKIGQTLPSMVDPITVHLKLQPSTLVPRSTSEESSISATAGNESSNEQPSAQLISESEDWMNGNFNYAEMSRIGEKTPEIDEAFLQYSSYFP
ncbi:hypothetical protein N7519_008394 [Penicillium mononematosum]|uniref:uncharacterized protein n=1 Tax=Penicillium mononematosum TaxID=268346 RepID=UPI002548CDB8|nr:uncharacterized protein N7519_008394 [Penicillium mononematosum]KAJ6177933.1 hypothetical protein N7519_008394 [Penicillium mononematosum]